MIYLVGGASRSGKSTLARKLAALLGISSISTDHLVQAFKAGVPAMEFATDTSDDSRAQKMAIFIKEFITRTLNSKQSFVLEGVHLLPEIVNEILTSNPETRACFLGFPNSTPVQELARVRQHPKYPGDWMATCTDTEALPYLEASIARSRRDFTACQTLGLQYFDTTENFDETQQQAINFLRAENTPNVRVGVGIYACHNDKLLIFQRMTDHAPGTWTPPGGHLENGEHWEETALRELKEECGIQAHSPHMFAVTNDLFPETGKHYVTLHVAVKVEDKTFTNAEPEKHKDFGWYKWEDVPQPRFACLQSLYNQNLKPTYLSNNA